MSSQSSQFRIVRALLYPAVSVYHLTSLLSEGVVPRYAGRVVYHRLDHHTVPSSAWRDWTVKWFLTGATALIDFKAEPDTVGGREDKTLQPVAPVNKEFSLSHFTLHRPIWPHLSQSWRNASPLHVLRHIQANQLVKTACTDLRALAVTA